MFLSYGFFSLTVPQMCWLLELITLSHSGNRIYKVVHTARQPSFSLVLKAICAIVFQLCIQNKNKTHLNKLLKPRRHQPIILLDYSTSQGQTLYSLYPRCLEQCLAYDRYSVNICWINQSVNIKVNFLFLSRNIFGILDGTVLTCETLPCTL